MSIANILKRHRIKISGGKIAKADISRAVDILVTRYPNYLNTVIPEIATSEWKTRDTKRTGQELVYNGPGGDLTFFRNKDKWRYRGRRSYRLPQGITSLRGELNDQDARYFEEGDKSGMTEVAIDLLKMDPEDNSISLKDVIDKYDNDLDLMVQESYWEGKFDTEKAYDLLVSLAEKDGLKIVEDNDYDSVLWDFYHIAEKGLS